MPEVNKKASRERRVKKFHVDDYIHPLAAPEVKAWYWQRKYEINIQNKSKAGKWTKKLSKC